MPNQNSSFFFFLRRDFQPFGDLLILRNKGKGAAEWESSADKRPQTSFFYLAKWARERIFIRLISRYCVLELLLTARGNNTPNAFLWLPHLEPSACPSDSGPNAPLAAVTLQICRAELSGCATSASWKKAHFHGGRQGDDRFLLLMFCILLFQGKTTHLVDITGNLASTSTIQMAVSSWAGLAISKLNPALLWRATFSPWPASHMVLSKGLCVLNITGAFQFLTHIHTSVRF